MTLRIASLLASGTEIACALGLADQLVAISHECDSPVPVLDRPRVTRARISPDASSADIDEAVRRLSAEGASLYDIDAAALAGLRPDVIITQSQCEVCAVSYHDVSSAIDLEPALRGVTIVDLNTRTLPDLFEDIGKVGKACGREREADALVLAFKDRVEAVWARTGNLPTSSRPTVLCLEWLDPPMVAGNWIPGMIDIAGGRCDLAARGHKSPYIEWGTITDFDPDAIVLMPCGFDLQRTLQEAEGLESCAAWKALRAVRAGRVHAVDANAYFNRAGPRLIDSLELLAHLLHPDLSPAPPLAGSSHRALATL